MQYITNSEKETRKLAEKLAHSIKSKGAVLALTGSLGAGKTTFVQGFAKGLRIKEKIISPTFVLIRQHQIKDAGMLYHIDLYRLERINLKELGLEEILSDLNNIVLIEWAEKIKDSLPENAIYIKFKNLGEDKREITIE